MRAASWGLQGKHRNIKKGVTYIGTQRECGLHTQGMSGGCEGYRICDGGSCPFYGKAAELVHNTDRKPVKIKITAPKKRGRKDTA